MSAIELLNAITQGLLIVLAALTILEFVRHRDRQRLDVALMFANLAAIILLQRLQAFTHVAWLEIAGSVLLLAHPVLLLRLVQHFRRLGAWVMPAALAGLLVTSAMLLAVRPPPVPFVQTRLGVMLTLVIVGYFVYFELHAIGVILRGASQSVGVARWRLRLAALGESFFAAIILLAGVSAALPATGGVVMALLLGLSPALAVTYYLAFAPPRWLRQSWQMNELLRFLRALGARSPDEPEAHTLNELRTRANKAVGGVGALVALWDEGHQALTWRQPAPEAGAPGLAPEGAIGQAWRERKPTVAHARAEFGPGNAWLAERYDAGSLLAVPITAAGRPRGLLVVLLRTTPIFADDDSALLALFAEQTATSLGYGELLRAQGQLVEKLQEHGRELEGFTQELEAISYSLSHDLRTPLRGIDGFAQALLEDYGSRLDDKGTGYLQRVRLASQRMGRLLDDFVSYLALSRTEREHEHVDLSALALEIAKELQAASPERRVRFEIETGLQAEGDPALLRAVLHNLLANAWKFSSKHAEAHIRFGAERQADETAYCVSDDGAGFDPAYAHKLFQPFQRLHPTGEFEGSGLGLAIVRRVVNRHGGRVWATGAPGRGATFCFTLAPRVTVRPELAQEGAVIA